MPNIWQPRSARVHDIFLFANYVDGHSSPYKITDQLCDNAIINLFWTVSFCKNNGQSAGGCGRF